MEKRRDVYLNPVQQRIFMAMARHLRVLAARRFGKTDGVIGPRIWAAAESQPQGAGAFLGSSRKQIYGRTIPGVIAAIERFYGFKEGTHFGWGKPPKDVPKCIIRPKSYDNCMWFANGHLIHALSLSVFGSANGMTLCEIFADECKFLPKKKIDEEVMPALSGIVDPFGRPGFTVANPFYKSTCFVSDASLTSRGDWLAKDEKMLDTLIEEGPCKGMTYRDVQRELDEYATGVMRYNELLRSAEKAGIRPIEVSEAEKAQIDALWDAICLRQGQFRILPPQYKDPAKIAEWLVNYKIIDADTAELLAARPYLMTHEQVIEMMAMRGSKKYQNHINDLRCNAFYFVRASSLDNIDILGEDYIRQMKLSLPPITFMVSILNMKLGKVGEGFYYAFDPDVHCYLPEECPAIEESIKVKQAQSIIGGTAYGSEYETPDFELLGSRNDCTMDGDVKDDQPLYIALDAGKIVNWIVTGQVYKSEWSDNREALHVLSSMFVKDGHMVQDLLRDWNQYYAPHRKKNKSVHLFYDHTFKFKPHGVFILDIKDTIIQELKKYGWDVNAISIGQAWPHHSKYRDIGEGMSGFVGLPLRMNKENNEALSAAIESCGTRLAYSGSTTQVKKDKAGEKLATDSERATEGATPEELRTDGTDAFDTLYIGCRHYRFQTSFLYTPGGH